MVTIPTELPKPLTIVTALSSMKAICKIFKDQTQFYLKFTPITVSAPFVFLGLDTFEQDVFNHALTDRAIIIVNKIKAIRDLAAGNIQRYEEIKDKKFEGSTPGLYILNNEGAAIPVTNETVKFFVLNEDNKQRQSFINLFWLYDFCVEVHRITCDFLAEPLGPKYSAAMEASEAKPPRKKKSNSPALTLVEYLDTDDNVKSLTFLKEQFAGQIGQTIAYMIASLKQIHVLKPTNDLNLYMAIKAEFGNIGTYQSIIKQKSIPDKIKNPKQYKKFMDISYKIAANIHKPII